MSAQRIKRLQVELKGLFNSPPPGVTCRVDDANAEVIIARIDGPENSPFQGACFEVEISPTERYPYTPPSAKFITEVYHPNIDSQGRICLSGLKSQPNGSWNCTMNMATILSAIRVLLAEPNLSDPLMADIAAEYQDDYQLYFEKAREKSRRFSVTPMQEKMEEEDTSVFNSSTCSNHHSNSPSRMNSFRKTVASNSPAFEDEDPDTSSIMTSPKVPEVLTVLSTDDENSLSPILTTSQRIMTPVATDVRDVKRDLFSQSTATRVSAHGKPASAEKAKPRIVPVPKPEPLKPKAALRVDDFMFDSDDDDFFAPPKKQAKLS